MPTDNTPRQKAGVVSTRLWLNGCQFEKVGMDNFPQFWVRHSPGFRLTNYLRMVQAIPYRSRHHVALREEVAFRAVGELAGIDLVVLLLGCSNRAASMDVPP
jgi:hypothetical protein